MAWAENDTVRQLPAQSTQAKHIFHEMCVRRDAEIRDHLRTGSNEVLTGYDTPNAELNLIKYLVERLHHAQGGTAGAGAVADVAGGGVDGDVGSTGGVLGEDEDSQPQTNKLAARHLIKPKPFVRSGFLIHYFDSNEGGFHPLYGGIMHRPHLVPKAYFELDSHSIAARGKKTGVCVCVCVCVRVCVRHNSSVCAWMVGRSSCVGSLGAILGPVHACASERSCTPHPTINANSVVRRALLCCGGRQRSQTTAQRRSGIFPSRTFRKLSWCEIQEMCVRVAHTSYLLPVVVNVVQVFHSIYSWCGCVLVGACAPVGTNQVEIERCTGVRLAKDSCVGLLAGCVTHVKL